MLEPQLSTRIIFTTTFHVMNCDKYLDFFLFNSYFSSINLCTQYNLCTFCNPVKK